MLLNYDRTVAQPPTDEVPLTEQQHDLLQLQLRVQRAVYGASWACLVCLAKKQLQFLESPAEDGWLAYKLEIVWEGLSGRRKAPLDCSIRAAKDSLGTGSAHELQLI